MKEYENIDRFDPILSYNFRTYFPQFVPLALNEPFHGLYSYSLINMRQLQILIISDCSSDQIKAKQFYDQAMQELRKNREIQRNQQTIQCQVLA